MDKFQEHIERMKGLRDLYEVGTGQHNILSMLINECELALRQPPVGGRSEQSPCSHCGLPLKEETANGIKPVLNEVKFVPNINYSRTTHNDIDYYIGVNGKLKTKFFGK